MDHKFQQKSLKTVEDLSKTRIRAVEEFNCSSSLMGAAKLTKHFI